MIFLDFSLDVQWERSSNLMEVSSINIKETWKIITNLLNMKSAKPSLHPSTVTVNKTIAEYLNYFIKEFFIEMCKCSLHFR